MNRYETADDLQTSSPVKQVTGQIVDDQRDAIEKQVEMLAWLLDESITISGLKMRVGVDGLIGMVPVVGDFISAALSMYIVACGHSLGASKSVLMRMSANSAIDFVVGSVPFVGDVFDFAWKANRRNVNLLRAHLQNPQRIERRSRWMVGIFATGMIAGVIGLFVLLGWLVSRLWS